MKFEFTERQVTELIQAMQCHTCNLDEEVRNQSDPKSPSYHCTGSENIRIMANELKVSKNILGKLQGNRDFF